MLYSIEITLTYILKIMPANKNAMTRYKTLKELLSSRYHNYSLDDLTEEVCKRLEDMYLKSYRQGLKLDRDQSCCCKYWLWRWRILS